MKVPDASKILSFKDKEVFKKISVWLPSGIMILFGLIYLVIVICNHYFFRTAAWDYGTYNFAFYDYAHLRISDNPIALAEHMSFLQDHVSFTLMLFLPFYWLFGWLTGTYTLLIIQTIFILYGAWAVYNLIKLKTNSEVLSILAMLQYLILLGRWTSFVSDCNIATIASSIVPVFLLFFTQKKFLWSLISFFFILVTREDMSLWMVFIGFFLLVSNYKDIWYRRFAVSIILVSVAYFIVTFTVIIPMIETIYTKYILFQYKVLGKGPFEALMFILKHPIDTVRFLVSNTSGNPFYDGVKLEFYYYYLICGGFLLLFRPRYILLFIPILARKMLNDDPVRWSNELFYAIDFVSIFPIAVFLIISELKSKRLRNVIVGIVVVTTLVSTVHLLQSANRKLNWWGDTKYAFYKSSMYRSDYDVKKIYNYLKLIPHDAKVSSTGHILCHLAFREKIYLFPRVEDAEYMVGLLEKDTYPLDQAQFDNEIKKYLTSTNWQYLVYDYPFFLARRTNMNIPITKH
jgi:uncharacterized membrane protein